MQFQHSLSLSLPPAGCALMSAITCDIYSLMFAMVRVCVRLPLPLCLPPIAIRKFHMQMYPAGVEPGNGEWGGGCVGAACPHCMWQQMSGGEAAAINHIHSLPVERAFNLHAELHIAYGRCLPTFVRSFSLDRVQVRVHSRADEEAVLRHTKVFNFSV